LVGVLVYGAEGQTGQFKFDSEFNKRLAIQLTE